MDCTCLRILLQAHAWLAASGGSVALTSVPPQIERLLDLTGMGAALRREAHGALSDRTVRTAE
jgi:anti-anti-sigma factor